MCRRMLGKLNPCTGEAVLTARSDGTEAEAEAEAEARRLHLFLLHPVLAVRSRGTAVEVEADAWRLHLFFHPTPAGTASSAAHNAASIVMALAARHRHQNAARGMTSSTSS